MALFVSLVPLLACLASLLSLTSGSPLWVLTGSKYVTSSYNVSILDPLTGTFSHSHLLTTPSRYDDTYQTGSNGVFAAATSTFMHPYWRFSAVTSGREWVYFNTRNETFGRVGDMLHEEQYYDGCSVRDEAAGVTWYLSFNATTEGKRENGTVESGTIGAFLWQYNDRHSISLAISPLFSVVLPFTTYNAASACSCAYDQENRLLFIQMNGGPPLLHTISIVQQSVVSSIAYPAPQPNGQRTSCYAITYSDQQQQLYSYLTSVDGLGIVGVQAGNPSTGSNTTLIDGSALNVTWYNQQAWDEESSSWFMADAQSGVIQLLKLAPTGGSVVPTLQINTSPITPSSVVTVVCKAAYAYVPSAVRAPTSNVPSQRSSAWTTMVQAMRRS